MNIINMNDVYYTILLHTDVSDLPRLCSSNQQLHKICQSKTFLINKFNQLPVHVDIFRTYENLLYITRLIKLSEQLLDYLYKDYDIHQDTLFYHSPNNMTLKQLSHIDSVVANRILSHAMKPVDYDYNKYRNPSDMNMECRYKIRTEFFYDGDYRIGYDINAPGSDVYGYITVTPQEAVNYLVNIFTTFTIFVIDDQEEYDSGFVFHGLSKLQQFLNKH